MNIKKESQATVTNSTQAEKIIKKYESRKNVAKIGFIIAVIATLLTVMSFIIDSPKNKEITAAIVLIAAICGIVSYIVGGGILKALKCACNLAMIGWIIIPFPFDIATGLVTLVLAIMGFFLFPVVFVAMSYSEIKNEYEQAVLFMNSNTNVEQ